jgi:hypothetical protein
MLDMANQTFCKNHEVPLRINEKSESQLSIRAAWNGHPGIESTSLAPLGSLLWYGLWLPGVLLGLSVKCAKIAHQAILKCGKQISGTDRGGLLP